MALTLEGYIRPTYDELLNSKIQTAKELFGEDIDTSEQTPLGKFIRINTFDLSKAYEDLEQLYYARFPNQASGVSLDRLCPFGQIARNPPTAATHKIKVFGTIGYSVPVGFLVGTASELKFYNMLETEIGADGTCEIEVDCVQNGFVGNIEVGEITEIINPNADIDAIEHIGIVSLGNDEENDVELRKRLNISFAGAGASNADAIRAVIARVPTVTSAKVVENKTDIVDVKGRPPHSFECYVFGGEAYHQQIAEAIFSKQPMGIGAISSFPLESPSRVDTVVMDSGGHPHDISFSHTENVLIKERITIKTNSKFKENGVEEIKHNVMEYINSLGVGATLVNNTIYSRVYAVEGVQDVAGLAQYKSIDGGATFVGSARIICEDFQVFQTMDSLIEVVISAQL